MNWNTKITCKDGLKIDCDIFVQEARFIVNKITPTAQAKKISKEELANLLEMAKMMNLHNYTKMECNLLE